MARPFAAKIPVGVLGATGMVGQQYIALLADHPWFEVAYVAASPRSAGKKYKEAVAGRWQATGGGLARLPGPEVSGNPWDLTVEDANDVSRAIAAFKAGRCSFVFSALEMGKDEISALETAYAAAGIPVVSNASAHRWTQDVPMLIAEVNPHHADIIPIQRKNRGWDRGFIAVKPNCSIQSYMTPLQALLQAGYEVNRLIVSTMQAVSGAGYPGVPSLDMIDNIVPYIGGEEEKSEQEPLKILGTITGEGITSAALPLISAHCNRVPVTDGHTACVSLEFGARKPSIGDVKRIWTEFSALPQRLDLPMAPKQPIIVMEEPDRPQPRKDRDADKAMAVSVGRIRPCKVFDLRFTALSHNTVRGAAGGGILNAELLKHRGFIT
ncbi:aspartate-semialdehyde dehydrogenase [Spirochaetia bacterium]|nr:aspartate-semialdehyde dehydrogenase [Spirochaetia bacterium]